MPEIAILAAKARRLFRRIMRALVPVYARVKARALVRRTIRALETSFLESARMFGVWRAVDLPFAPARPRTRQTRHSSREYLQHLNTEAIIALNEVDIGGCIRAATPVASLSCADVEIEKLRLKEVACHFLAVALLQGLGRLDEALFWWRERKRVFAILARHYLGNDGLVPDPANLIFDQFWSSHIGHTAMLGIHVKRNLLEGQPYRSLTLLRTPEPNPGNRCLVDHWQQYFTLAEGSADFPLSSDYLHYCSKNLFLDERLVGPETYFWQVYAEISRAWEQANGGALLELSKDELQRGQKTLAALGIPDGAWYVCLHVRSAGFKPIHEGLHDTLNADIETYDLAIESVVKRGGWIIRMGDSSMPKLFARSGVVDYPHSAHKSDWMDVFLCATCRFYVGTSSGLAYVPNLFSTPSVFTNWFPTGTRPLNGSDIFIPKMHRYRQRNDFAPFAESLAPPFGHIHVNATLESLGVSLMDNSREDLRDVVVEMMDRLEGKSLHTTDDERLQARFDAVANTSRSFGNARIGREFIRKYRALLPDVSA